MCSYAFFDWILGLLHKKGLHSYKCGLVQKPMVGDVIGSMVEPNI